MLCTLSVRFGHSFIFYRKLGTFCLHHEIGELGGYEGLVCLPDSLLHHSQGPDLSCFCTDQSKYNISPLNLMHVCTHMCWLCIGYPLAYLKYSNKYALTENVSAYACQNYLCKIVVLCISMSTCW